MAMKDGRCVTCEEMYGLSRGVCDCEGRVDGFGYTAAEVAEFNGRYPHEEPVWEEDDAPCDCWHCREGVECMGPAYVWPEVATTVNEDDAPF